MPPDDLAVNLGNRTTEVGAAAGFLSWLASGHWIGLSGVLIAGAGLVVNWYFQRRRDRRERELHAARLAAMRDACEL